MATAPAAGSVPSSGGKPMLKLLDAQPRNWQKDEDPSYDLVVAAKSRDFHVHSALLTAHSPVFARMLTHDFVEKRERRVEISDCTSKQIEAFLQQLYLECPLSLRNITLFFPVAHKYMVKRLMKNAVDWLKKAMSSPLPARELFDCLCAVTKYLSAEETPQWDPAAMGTIAHYAI